MCEDRRCGYNYVDGSYTNLALANCELTVVSRLSVGTALVPASPFGG